MRTVRGRYCPEWFQFVTAINVNNHFRFRNPDILEKGLFTDSKFAKCSLKAIPASRFTI